MGSRPGDHHSRRECRDLRRLDRAFRGPEMTQRLNALGAPSIEQLAFDLRRLDRERRKGPARYSEVWLAAVLSAYDIRLQLACSRLGVPEKLQPLQGADREQERDRIEICLAEAGLILRSPRTP
ncbi:hypothetical protein [Actinoplanes sp. NBRC 101535]|uniref:hypothetical protein n=1 Tax=Actinoplanes sp. NBRC 101535 TaxID=3032196 RepID=UPI002556D525|nr:hypothetical protein [Actinoplanes sp. NBRC 101535]